MQCCYIWCSVVTICAVLLHDVPYCYKLLHVQCCYMLGSVVTGYAVLLHVVQ